MPLFVTIPSSKSTPIRLPVSVSEPLKIVPLFVIVALFPTFRVALVESTRLRFAPAPTVTVRLLKLLSKAPLVPEH